MSARRSTTPPGLREAGKRLWRAVIEEFELSASEQRVLEHACRELDLIERIDFQLASDELVVKGSMGQPVPNGLLTEIRQHRSTFAALMAKLALPTEGGSAGSRSAAGRNLALVRWNPPASRGA